MKKIFFTFFLVFSATILFAQKGNDLIKAQHKQEKTIKDVYKKEKITELEYNKLMREQSNIKGLIETATIDNHWSSVELNQVNAKLVRASKRITRYQMNSEKY